MKLARLVDQNLHNALQKLAGTQLPLKTAFKLKGIIKVAREEADKYEEVRQDALKQHGQKNDDGTLKTNEAGNVQFNEEGMRNFVAQLNELIQVEIPIQTLTVEELGDKVALSAQDLEHLEGIIVEA